MTQSMSIRQGLIANLQPLSIANGGIIGQLSPYMLSNPTPPAIFVSDGPIEYDLAMHRGLDELTFTVVVFLQFTSDIGAQTLMDELREPLGATSIKTLLESDKTLGGVVDDLTVVRASEPKLYERASGQPFLGAEWTVTVEATPH